MNEKKLLNDITKVIEEHDKAFGEVSSLVVIAPTEHIDILLSRISEHEMARVIGLLSTMKHGMIEKLLSSDQTPKTKAVKDMNSTLDELLDLLKNGDHNHGKH